VVTSLLAVHDGRINQLNVARFVDLILADQKVV
jgi:hypothetical protein